VHIYKQAKQMYRSVVYTCGTKNPSQYHITEESGTFSTSSSTDLATCSFAQKDNPNLFLEPGH
jgi:hypothetical protein